MSDDVKIPLPRSLQEIVGSLLFASEVPLSATDLRTSVRAVAAEEGENHEIMDVYQSCTSKEIEEALRGLEKALNVADCGFKLVCTGGTYRLQTTPSCGRYVRAMLKLDRPNRLGRASLETLAIVAYRQPLTKSEIEDIRGVDVSANIKTLMELQLIRLVGKSELPGHPFLYGTTPIFLEHFGLASLQQLNELDPTLQRSNPRQKAAAYKRPEKKAEPAPAPEGEATAPEGTGAAAAGEMPAEEIPAEEIPAEEIPAEEIPAEETSAGDPPRDDDDDFFIDDTPDELDDEDDDDDEEEDEEDDEDEVDADADAADGADDADGV